MYLSRLSTRKISPFKKKELNVENKLEFPSLIQEEQEKTRENPREKTEKTENQLNYKDASLTKKEQVTEETLEPGWIWLHPGNMKEIKKYSISRRHTDEEYDEYKDSNKQKFKKDASRVFSKMIKRWDNYKRKNREVYGEKNEVEYDSFDSQDEEENSSEETENEEFE
jgi:hypothetical protein